MESPARVKCEFPTPTPRPSHPPALASDTISGTFPIVAYMESYHLIFAYAAKRVLGIWVSVTQQFQRVPIDLDRGHVYLDIDERVRVLAFAPMRVSDATPETYLFGGFVALVLVGYSGIDHGLSPVAAPASKWVG
jgi:hypothetical protein